MNSILSSRLAKWLLSCAIACAAILLSVVGLVLDKQGFLCNLLAEVVGVLVSVIVALVVVDKWTEFHTKKQWEKVRSITYDALAAHICDMLTQVFIFFPIKNHRPMTPIIEGRSKPNPVTTEAISELASQLRQLPSAITAEKSTSDLSIEFHEDVKWDLDQIRDVLTPRIMQSGADQAVVDALMEFDAARRNMQNAIIAHEQVTTHGVFPYTIELVEKAGNLYDRLSEHWGKDRG